MAAPPIVLVPGIDGTGLLFYRQQPLLERRFQTVIFPLPSCDPGSMTIETLSEQLADVVVAQSSPDASSGAILLGESFGGALAMHTAIHRPDLVRGLVIVNSFPYLAQRLRLFVAPRLLRVLPWGAMPLVRRYTSTHLHSPHAHRDDIREFLSRARHIDRRSYIRRLEIIRGLDLRDQLHRIEAPTLFLAGDRDRLLPSERLARYMHERVSHSDVSVLEGYGHVCLIDRDLDLLTLVGPWWDSVAGT
jgi:3-oxoadipate enol-lactonase